MLAIARQGKTRHHMGSEWMELLTLHQCHVASLNPPLSGDVIFGHFIFIHTTNCRSFRGKYYQASILCYCLASLDNDSWLALARRGEVNAL